jgi:hypothetical protein
MQEVLDDPQLRKQLASVGLVVDKSGGTISFELNLGAPQMPLPAGQAGITAATSAAADLKIKMNIDHAKTDFADAIDTWINTGATDALSPVLAGSNMRIVTGLENQVFFTRLKKDAEKWVSTSAATEAKSLQGTTAPLPDPIAWETPAWSNRIDGVVGHIEALLGKSISARERQSVLDYVDMAMQMTKQ